MNIIQQAISIAIEDSPTTLIREILKRLNLHGGLYLFLVYWSHRLTGHTTVYKNVLGSKMKLDISHSGVHSDLFLCGIREVTATQYFSKILTGDMAVVDIGANIGYYALQEAKVCKQVYAIEPAPGNYARLVENINLNNYTNITTHNLAVGDKKGEVKFSLSPVPNWHRVAIGDSKNNITVPITTLDEFIGGKRVDIVRMDVEGYELNILKGMEETLRKNSLWLFIETHKELIEQYGGSLRDLYEILAQHNFKLEYSIIKGRPSITGYIKDLINDKRLYQGLGSWLFLKRGT